MRKPLDPRPFGSQKKGYHVALATALLMAVLGGGLFFQAPPASAATVRASHASLVHTSLRPLQLLHPADSSGGGCQYGSEELTMACISYSPQGQSSVVASGYIEVRTGYCSMEIYVVSVQTGNMFGGVFPCDNMLGFVGSTSVPASPGDKFYAYVALYINYSGLWSSAYSPVINIY